MVYLERDLLALTQWHSISISKCHQHICSERTENGRTVQEEQEREKNEHLLKLSANCLNGKSDTIRTPTDNMFHSISRFVSLRLSFSLLTHHM